MDLSVVYFSYPKKIMSTKINFVNSNMKTSFQIFKVWGIPIKIHISFLLILPIFAYIFATNTYFFNFLLEETPLLAYGLGAVLVILFFLCILLHELGHSFVALKSGIDMSNITLMIFGGVSSMDEPNEDPNTELKLALAGPAVSIVIGSILLLITFALGLELPILVSVESVPSIMLGWLGYINLVLAGFNLIPAFPMDGGRVLRSLLAKKMSYIDATEKAASVGKTFAFLLGLFGLLTFPQGIWFILIASFIYIGASEEEKATQISGALKGKEAKDLMTKEVVSVSPDNSLEEVIKIIREKKHMGYPVLENDELVGVITFSDIQDVPEQEKKGKKVRDIMTTDLKTVKSTTEAYEALKKMSSSGVGRLPVVENKELVGILSRSDFTTAFQLGELWSE